MKRFNGFLKKFNYLFTKKQRQRMILLVVMLVCVALFETATTAMILPLMNTIATPGTLPDSRIRILVYQFFGCRNNTDFMVVISAAVAIMYLLKGPIVYLSNRAVHRFSCQMQYSISVQLFNCYMGRSYQYHAHHNSALIQRNVISNATKLTTLVNSLMSFFSELFVTASLFAMLMAVNTTLTLLAAGMIVLTILVVNRAIAKVVSTAGKRSVESSGHMIRWVAQSVGGFKSIKVGMREPFFSEEFRARADEYCDMNFRYSSIVVLPRVVVETFCMVGIFLFLAFFIMRNTSISTILPVLSVFALSAVRMMPAANRMNAFYNAIVFNMPALDSIYDVFVESGIAPADCPINDQAMRPAVMHTEPLKTGIEIQNVSFRFEDAERPLFNSQSLQIPARKSTAFVGTTGSGKTTMADIILGLQVPESGRVLVDGHDIHQDREWWADRVGYIPQEVYLIDDTIRANVAFGYDPATVDDAWVWKCLEDAQLKEFVAGLPGGLSSKTGEKGQRLSGGQRQRIGIARALYTDPQVLVMDEATSALDNETERAIVDAINRLSGEKTLLIIAHRLTTIQNCDLIYRIEDGVVTREK